MRKITISEDKVVTVPRALVKAVKELTQTTARDLLLMHYVHQVSEFECTKLRHSIMVSVDLWQDSFTYKEIEVEYQITESEYLLVKDLMCDPNARKVTAIKFIRGQYTTGLREAKLICEKIADM